MDTKLKLRSILQIILYKYPLLYPASLYLYNNAIILDSKNNNSEKDIDIVTNNNKPTFISTMAVDNLGKLYVNKKFFDSLDMNTALFVYLHEVLHFIFKHIDTYIEHILPKFSNSGINPSILLHLANLGMDMAVNSALSQDLNLKIENAVYPEDFGFESMKSFEYYFTQLIEKFKNDQEFNLAIQYFVNQILEEIKKQLQDSNCNSNNCQTNSKTKPKKDKKLNNSCNNSNTDSNNLDNINNNNDFHNNNLQNNKYINKLKEYLIDEHLFEKLVSEELRKQLNETVKRLMEQGLTLHQNCRDKNIGNGIAEMTREFLENQYKPKVDWKNILKIHLDIIADNRRRSFIKPNRKISSYIAPGYITDFTENINPCIMIDLSGSISDEEFTQFVHELLKLFKTYKIEKIRFIAFTDGIVFDKTFEISKDEKLDKDWLFKNVNFNYSGGTSIKETLKKFEEDKQLDVGIIFTDCVIDDWYKINKPNKHIFVISTTNKKAPFYKTIHL